MKRPLVLMTVFLLLCIYTSASAVEMKFYESHEKARWAKQCVKKLKSHLVDIPAIANRRILIRIFSWEDSPNAFINYDARFIFISISDSLLAKLKGNDIFCILAHELAHAEYNHSGTQGGISALISIAFIAGDILAPDTGVGALDCIVNPLVVTAYSRKDELEADSRAIEYLSRIGISYKDFIVTLEFIKSLKPLSQHGGGIIDTHPNFNERIENAEQKGRVIEIVRDERVLISEKKSAINDFSKIEKREIPTFDIGPYGEAKVSKLAIGLTGKEIKNIFDGYKADKKKRVGKEKVIWTYDIPDTSYRFAILLKGNKIGDRKVIDYTICPIEKGLNEELFVDNGKMAVGLSY